jgi:carboxylate-amine ligase
MRQAQHDFRPELLRAASWKAARHGVSDELFDPATGHSEAAAVAVDRLLAYVESALRERGELLEVQAAIDDISAGGGGAERQRHAAHGGGISEVPKAMTIGSKGTLD